MAPLLVVGLPLAALAAASAQAVYPHDAHYELLIAAAFAVFWLALVVAIGRDRGIPLALGFLALGGDALALDGLRQFVRGRPTPVGWIGPFAAQIPVRISATLHNPNVLAAVLLLTVGPAAGLAVGARGRAGRLLGLACLVPAAVALPLTFSRAAYVSPGGLVVLAAVAMPRDRRGSGLAALGALVVPLLLVAVVAHGVLLRVHTISVQGGGDVASRLFGWGDALAIWAAHPILAAGPGGLQALCARHHTVGDARGTYMRIDIPGSPDNAPLQWLAQTGLVGVAALLAAIGIAVVAAWRGRRRFGPYAAAGAPLAAAVLAMAAPGTAGGHGVRAADRGAAGRGVGDPGRIGGQVGPVGSKVGRGLLGAGLVVAGVALARGLHAAWAPQVDFARGWARMQAGHPRAAPRAAGAGGPHGSHLRAQLGRGGGRGGSRRLYRPGRQRSDGRTASGAVGAA